MKLAYYSDTDSLYIDLSERPSAESREISEGVVLDYDDAGNLVGIDIDIDNASRKVQLGTWSSQACKASSGAVLATRAAQRGVEADKASRASSGWAGSVSDGPGGSGRRRNRRLPLARGASWPR